MSQSNSASEASGMPEVSTVTGDCMICIDENVQLLSLPCSHSGFCFSCHALELTNLQEDSRRPSCPICNSEIPLQVLQPLLPTDLYERMFHKFYVEWATPITERLWCANTDCANFVPVSAPLSMEGARQCLPCGTFTCVTCKQLAHDGACAVDQELLDVIRVQHEIDEQWDEQRTAEANALFEGAGRPLARQVLAGSHVFIIMLREYFVRIGDADFDMIYGIIGDVVQSIHDIDAPITPRALLTITQAAGRLLNRDFETVNIPGDEAYNLNQYMLDTLFVEDIRKFRSQEFIDYEREATRKLAEIYDDTDPDANELRNLIREKLSSFGTT
ncbi:hypothetical protein KCU67_g9096, partial [Aureobasidium melanogenum]